MVFRTELDGPVTRNTARQGVDAAHEIPEQHEPLKGRCLVPIKFSGDPPFTEVSFSLRLAYVPSSAFLS
jgi:hypothetical protein